MNGKQARRIRKDIYWDISHRYRSYFTDSNGTVKADGLREMYQRRKKREH